MRVGIAVTGAVTCVLVVAMATLGPVPIDRDYRGAIARILAALHRNGIPRWFDYRMLEASGNVLMFLPLGFFLALLLRGRWRWAAVVLVPLVSTAIEVTQGLLLPQRFASAGDVLANSIGGWVGVALAAALVGLVHGRDRRLRGRWERERSGSVAVGVPNA